MNNTNQQVSHNSLLNRPPQSRVPELASTNKNGVPEMRMSISVRREIMQTIGAYPPESGGILLGPIDSNDITAYYFDSGARCGAATYSPNHIVLIKKMQEEWMPFGLDMKGFVHSHPGLEQLSNGDVTYIRRLLEINPDMEVFAAPIVLPQAYRICPFVVFRDAPTKPKRARLILA